MYLVPDMVFICCFCDSKADSLDQHIKHYKFHGTLSRYKHCGFNGCKRTFESTVHLKKHLIRVHNAGCRGILYKSMSNALINTTGHFVCTIIICQKEYINYKDFIRHLKDHMLKGESVQCPFPTCTKTYRNVSSFTSHFSKNHKSISNEMPNRINSENSNIIDRIEEMENEDVNHELESNNHFRGNEYQDISSDLSNEDFEQLYFTNLATLYLKF